MTMNAPLLFSAFAIALRTGLFYAGIELEGFTFGFVLLGLVTVLVFLCGHFTLNEEPNAPLPMIFRAGLQGAAVFALVYALFLLLFFKVLNTAEFPMRVAGLIHDSTAQGVPEEEARRNINAFFTPGRYAFTTFAGLLGVGTVNALVFAVLQHKVLRRFRNR
ncbi:MAG TPA: hypothetical protein PL106_08740 [Flavobacteriales bacterium]|nr:hypothetical protein [Flavobacteriales bacterium]